MRPRPGALGLCAGLACLATAVSAPGQGADLALGERVYRDNCAVCHGATGDGQGMAVHHFRHRPRDFTKGRFKFRSTASGQLPTDADLRRTILQGVPSTGMVPQDHLTPAELDAVVLFLKSLSPRFATSPTPKVLATPPAPARTPDAIARGGRVYERAECAECHGREGRGDGPSAKDLSIKPSDLTKRPFKSGPEARDIVRTLVTGLDGTPMPSYYQVLEDADLWDLAWYVASLGGAPEVTEDERWGWHVERTHQLRRRP